MGIIQKQGIQNTIISYIGILIGFLNLILIQPFFLTPEEIGLTRVLFSFSSLVAVFLPLGIGSIIFRYFPKFRNETKGHHGFLGFMLLFPAAGLLVVTVILFSLKGFFISKYIAQSALFTEYYDYVLPLSFLLGLINILTIYASSLFKTSFPALLNDVVGRLLTILVISAYFLHWININQFVFFFVFVYAIQLGCLIIYVFSIERPVFRIDFVMVNKLNIKEMLQYGFLLAFASIAGLGLRYLDAIMIGKYMALSFVGIYTIASFIPAVLEAPLNSIDKIAFSKIANALETNNRKEIEEIYFKSSKYLFLLGGLMFLGININIDSLLGFLPEVYHHGGTVVLIISIGTLFNLASGTNNSLIYTSEHYRVGAFLLIFLVVIAFINNMIFIPLYGIEGAALATAISTILNSLIRFVFIWKKFNLQPYDSKTAMIALLIVICSAVNYLITKFENPVFDIVLRSSFISLIYCTGVYFLNIVPEFHRYIPLINRNSKKE